MYNFKKLSELSLEVGKYEIYLIYGHGTVESPLQDGPVVMTYTCSEAEAWIIAEAKNIELWGTKSKRSSFEIPTVHYRKSQ